MRLLAEIWSSEVVYRLGWALLHTFWLGLAVALVLGGVLAALRRRSANLRYVVACAALAVMVALPVIAYLATPVPAGAPTADRVAPAAPMPVDATVPRHETILADAAEADAGRVAPVDSIGAGAGATPRARADRADPPGATATAPDAPATDTPAATGEASLVDQAMGAVEPALPWIVAAWAVGAFALSLLHLCGWSLAQRMTRLGVRPAGREIIAMADELALAMGLPRPVEILESMRVAAPAVIGHLRPVILVPVALATGLTGEQLRAILAHELAHVRRWDYLVNLLQTLVETVMFYHPAAWYISRRIRIEREHCCDDAALGAGAERLSYAESLLHLAGRSAGMAGVPAAALAAGGQGGHSQLRCRIARLLGRADETARVSRGWPIALAVMVALAAAVVVPLACRRGGPTKGPERVSQSVDVFELAKTTHIDGNDTALSSWQAQRLGDMQKRLARELTQRTGWQWKVTSSLFQPSGAPADTIFFSKTNKLTGDTFAIHVTTKSVVVEAASPEGFDKAIDALLGALVQKDGKFFLTVGTVTQPTEAAEVLDRELAEAKRRLKAILPETMAISRAEVLRLGGETGLLLHASLKNRSKAHPSLAMFLWPRSNATPCPYESGVGAHTFVRIGTSGQYVLYYSNTQGYLRAEITRAFGVKAAGEWGRDRLKIEFNRPDKLPGGLYAVGPFDRPWGQAPDAHLLYQWRIEKKIGDGYEQLVGRLPLAVYGLGVKGGGAVEALDFARSGNRIVGTLKYTLPLKGFGLKAHSVYVRAFLPKLPPGQYEVEIGFEEHYRTADGKAGPGPKGSRPRIPAMTCKFQMPDPRPVTRVESKTENAKAVRSLIERLNSTRSGAFRHASEALGKMGPMAADAVPALIEGLQDRAGIGYWWSASGTSSNVPEFGLLTLAEDADPNFPGGAYNSRRVFAAEALAKIGAAAVAPLMQAMEDKELDVRRMAAWSLSKMGPPAVPRLSKALEDENKEVRRRAGWALARIGPPAKEAIPVFLKALKVEYRGLSAQAGYLMRPTVASRLRKIGPKAVPYLVAALKDEDDEIRLWAAWSLGKIGPAGLPILGEALKDKNSAVRCTAMRAVEEIGPEAKQALPALIRALKDDDAKVRAGAVRALAKLGPKAKAVVPKLVQLLKDEDRSVQWQAAAALGEIDPAVAGKEAVPVLIKALKDTDGQVQRVVIPILQEMGPVAKEAAPALIQILHDGHSHGRYFAAGALGEIGLAAKEAIPALIRAIKDKNTDVRISAVVALGKIGPAAKEAIPTLTEALKDKNERVRNRVADALRKIGATKATTRSTTQPAAVVAAAGPPINEQRKAEIGKEVAAAFTKAVVEHARGFGKLRPAPDGGSEIDWSLMCHDDTKTGGKALNRSAAMDALVAKMAALAAKGAEAEVAAYVTAAGGFLTHKAAAYRAVACEVLYRFLRQMVELDLVPGVGSLLDDDAVAFVGADVSKRSIGSSIVKLGAKLSVAEIAQATLLTATSCVLPNRKVFQTWWQHNKDYRRRLWYWALRWRLVKPESDLADLAGLKPREALKILLLVGNNPAGRRESLLGFPSPAELRKLGFPKAERPKPFYYLQTGPLPRTVADFVRKHSLKPVLIEVLRQEIAWPEVAGHDWEMDLLLHQTVPVMALVFDKSDAAEVGKALANLSPRLKRFGGLAKALAALAAGLSNGPTAGGRTASSAWSESAGGLSGRLIVATDQILSWRFFEVFVELKNVGKAPLAVQADNPFAFDMMVCGEGGPELKPTWTRMDIQLHPLRWIVIPPGASRRVKVTIQSTDGAKGAHLDTTTEIWKLKPGKYRLTATYSSKGFFPSPDKKLPAVAWQGKIALPPLAVEVVQADAPTQKRNEPFDKQTLSLIERLQKNPWANWPTGTEVVRQYVDDRKPGQKVQVYLQPDITYKVLERDRRFIRTQAVNGKPQRQDFRIQDQAGGGVPRPHVSGKGVASELAVDGAKVECLLYESAMTKWLTGGAVVRTVTKQWVLSSHPTILLRRHGHGRWTITSVRARRRIGKQEYLCIETKGRLSPPDAHVVITRYLHPDVPGHLVEEIKEFYKVVKGKREPVPWLVTHEKTSAVRVIARPPARQNESKAAR